MTDAEDLKALFEAGKKLGKAHLALVKILHWCRAYPTTGFTPVSDRELQETAELLKRMGGVSLEALHAQWARHLLDGIARIAEEELEESGNQDA